MRNENMSQRTITIFVGNYGSGKTEIALNMALENSQKRPTILVDLDIVNPYFRSGEKKEWLNGQGIRVLMPNFANTAVDVPSLPAEIQRVFDQKNEDVIIDVGGDDTGAAALGRYFPYLLQEIDQIKVYFVVNTLRPLSMNESDIMDLITRVQARARLKVTGLVHNTNLANLTDVSQLLAGEKIMEAVSKKLNVPVVSTVVTQNLYDQLPDEMKKNTWIIQRRMKPEWMEESDG